MRPVKDLTTLTTAEHVSVVKRLAKKPLKELRRRQELINAQIRRAHKAENTTALFNLQIMQRHVDVAVDAKVFSEEAS